MRREKPCPEPLLIVYSDRPSVLNPQKPRQIKAIAGHFPVLACLHSSAWTLSWYPWVGLGARRMVFLSSLCCSQVGIITRPQNCAVGIVSLVIYVSDVCPVKHYMKEGGIFHFIPLAAIRQNLIYTKQSILL